MEDIDVVFRGFKTLDQAVAFANWYAGCGEQQAGNLYQLK
jgi:hypothetical protein